MCAAPNSTHSTSIQSQTATVPDHKSSSQTSKSPVPKWLKMKQQNKSSAGKDRKAYRQAVLKQRTAEAKRGDKERKTRPLGKEVKARSKTRSR